MDAEITNQITPEIPTAPCPHYQKNGHTKERRWPELASEHLQENFRKVLEAWQLARAIRYRGNDIRQAIRYRAKIRALESAVIDSGN